MTFSAILGGGGRCLLRKLLELLCGQGAKYRVTFQITPGLFPLLPLEWLPLPHSEYKFVQLVMLGTAILRGSTRELTLGLLSYQSANDTVTPRATLVLL